jgi:hypothetical protein
LSVGDRVLVRVVAYDGKHKIADKWEDHPYLVIKQPNEDIPVFKVRREDGEGRCRVLHRNLLLPIGSKFTSTRPPKPTPRPRQKAGKRDSSVLECTNSNISFISDSDSEFSFIDNSMMARCSQQDTPSQDGDDLSLTREASEFGSEEDALQQDEPEDQPGNDDDGDDLSEDTAPSFDTEPDTETTPVPTPRRSSRQRKTPEWTKEYVMMAQTQADWLQRATFVKEMMENGLLKSVDSSVCQMTLLNIVSSSR